MFLPLSFSVRCRGPFRRGTAPLHGALFTLVDPNVDGRSKEGGRGAGPGGGKEKENPRHRATFAERQIDEERTIHGYRWATQVPPNKIQSSLVLVCRLSSLVLSMTAEGKLSRGWSSSVLSSLPLLLGFLLPCLSLYTLLPTGASSFFLAHAAFSCLFLSPTKKSLHRNIEDARALLPTERRRQPESSYVIGRSRRFRDRALSGSRYCSLYLPLCLLLAHSPLTLAHSTSLSTASLAPSIALSLSRALSLSLTLSLSHTLPPSFSLSFLLYLYPSRPLSTNVEHRFTRRR